MKKVKYHILDLQQTKNHFSRETGSLSPFEIGIPLVDISDKTIEEIYYFRWHTYCKHIKNTPAGYVVTEFLPDVPWAGKYNTINCPAGHHFYEGRWFHDQKYIDSYARFWFTEDASPRLYSFWAADSILAVSKVTGDFTVAEELYEKLKENYAAWEKEKKLENGLFYQIDDKDGMEYSAGGSGCRPTINSYMYGGAIAISKIAARLSKVGEVAEYAEKARMIKEKADALLWDEDACFYKTLSVKGELGRVPVRELIGYIPWYFNLPDRDKALAWKFLNDEAYFDAPYGPTTTERNCPDFMKEFDHECLWNGPSWPFATSQTLTALANLLCNYEQDVMNKSDYYRQLKRYANCHYLTENGRTVPFIDENLDPFTGEWIARKLLHEMENPPGGADRGADYNHSSFCDLVLSGLAGIRAREDDVLEVNPLFAPEDLEYFCADGILYHGHEICVLWDRTGERYHKGKGFYVYCDGNETYRADVPGKADIYIGEGKKGK